MSWTEPRLLVVSELASTRRWSKGAIADHRRLRALVRRDKGGRALLELA